MKFLTKKIIPYILVLVIFIVSILSCYHTAFAANIQPIVESYEIGKLIETWQNPDLTVAEKLKDTLYYGAHGLIMPRRDLPSLEEYMDQQISNDTGKDKSNITEDDRKDWANNNVFIDVDNKSIRTTNNFNTIIKNVAQDYIDSNRVYYGYSLNLEYYSIPEGVKNFIQEHQGNHNIFMKYDGTYFAKYLFTIIKDEENYGYVLRDLNDFNYIANAFSNKTFDPYSPNTGVNQPVSDFVDYYYYDCRDSTIHKVETLTYGVLCRDNNFVFMNRNYSYRTTDFPLPNYTNTNFSLSVSYGNTLETMIYGSYGLFTSSQRGMPPYVITNNWNNFINNEGDYTLNIDNSNHTSYEDLRTWIEQYFQDHDRYPTSEEINNYITNNNQTIINNYYITPTPTPGPGGTVSGNGSGGNTYVTNNYYVSGNVVPGSGNDPKTGKGIWDFLTELVSKLGDLINTIASSIGDVISALAALPGQIIDFFTIDGEQVSAALSEATVSMNNLKNEVIPSEQIKSTLAPLNISEIYYPKLTIKTPAIIRQYYDEEEIILLDFEKWAKYFVVVRSLLVFSFWFAFIYYTLASVRPHVDIGS